MQHNHIIKHAVTTALSVMVFGVHSSSFALGLSDIDVTSNLGQKLKANVNVLGANDLKDTACLRLGPNSDLNHLNLSLGTINGDIAKLTITSTHIINEPIVNFSLIAGCENTVRRDYVLLLDPPLVATNSVELNTIDAPANVDMIDTTVEMVDTTVDNSSPAPILEAQKPKPSIKKSKKKLSVSQFKSTKDNKKVSPVAVNTQGITDVQPIVESGIIKSNPEARLSISGGSFTPTDINNMTLRLDRQLSFNPDLTSDTVATESVAIEDEITVMNKRLAHLQQQINVLQEQNLKLASDNQLKSAQLIEAEGLSLGNVLAIIGTGAILWFGGYVGLNWLRRRQSLLQTHNTEAIWINTGKDTESSQPNTNAERSDFDEINFDIKENIKDNQLIPNSMQSTFESTKTEEDAIFMEDDQEFSVLDHADVFLSHGRATLAIQLLQNHLLEYPKQSVTIWLFLLDLLAKENLQKLYDQTAEDCKLHYNINISAFKQSESLTSESLEDFPRLAEGLAAVWNTPAAVTFLDDLIYNNRLEPRAGLAKNLIEELVLLRSMAQENVNSAQVISLDEKKLALNEEKEALLQARKAEKLKEMALEQRKVQAEVEAKENIETEFDFTLVEKY